MPKISSLLRIVFNSPSRLIGEKRARAGSFVLRRLEIVWHIRGLLFVYRWIGGCGAVRRAKVERAAAPKRATAAALCVRWRKPVDAVKIEASTAAALPSRFKKWPSARRA